MRVLEFFLDAARDQEKVVNLHTKGAEHEIAQALWRFETRRAIVHWYSGPMDAFASSPTWCLLHRWPGGALRSDAIREIARAIPPERLLTETDNPGAFRGPAGELMRPRALLDVLDELARVLGRSTAAVETQVHENFLALVDGDARLLDPSGARSSRSPARPTVLKSERRNSPTTRKNSARREGLLVPLRGPACPDAPRPGSEPPTPRFEGGV